MCIRDSVEAFDVAGRTVQVQLLLHGGHQAFGMPFGILDLEVLELFGAVNTGCLLYTSSLE